MDSWDNAEIGLLLAALLGIHADISATKEDLREGGKETNPLLSKHPTGEQLDQAAILSGLLGIGGAHMLSPKNRKRMLGAWAGLEHGLGYKNRTSAERQDFGESLLGPPLIGAALGLGLGELLGSDNLGFYASGEGKNKEMGLTFKKGF